MSHVLRFDVPVKISEIKLLFNSARLWNSNGFSPVYCLNMLQEMEHPKLDTYLIDLLDNPHWQIRLEALKRIEIQKFYSALEGVRKRVEKEEISKIKGVALRVLCELDKNFSYEKVAPFLKHADSDIRKGVIVGLFRNGGSYEVRFAENHLNNSIQSPHWKDRLFAAEALGDTESVEFHEPLLQLLRDENTKVLNAALNASGRLKIHSLWPEVLKNIEHPATHTAAFSAYLKNKSEFKRTILKPLTEKKENIYVVKDSDAEAHVTKRFPNKSVRHVANAIRPTSVEQFLMGAPLVFNRHWAAGLNAVYHFRFSGEEVRGATITIRNKTLRSMRGMLVRPT